MTFEKTNHFLFKIFVFLLVVTQGIIFVTTRAAFDDNKNLEVQFLLSSQQFVSGDIVPMKANLASEQDFALVYFNLQQEGADNFLQIQAVHDTDGIWSSDSSWDTGNFGPGKYHLSVRAIALDENGAWEKTVISQSLELELLAPVQAAIQTNNDSGTIKESDIKAALASSTEEIVVASSTEVLATFVSPSAQATISTDDITVDIALDQALAATDVLGLSLYDSNAQLIKEYSLTVLASDAKRWQTDLGVINQFNDGEYNLVVWLNTKENFISSPLVFNILKNTDTQVMVETNPDNYQILFTQPENNTVITDSSAEIKFNTNFIANSAGILMNKIDDVSIGEEFILTKVDGLAWTHIIQFSDYLINGDYTLAVIAVDENGVPVENSLGITLDRVGFDQNVATSTDATASSTPEVSMCQTDSDCLNLCSGCYTASSTPEVDCAAVPSGTCACVANVCLRQETASSTEDLHDECLAGEECLAQVVEYQSLDPLCLAENILEAVACEDYLNRTVVDLLCQKKQIFDPSQCRQYLAETYASDVVCANQTLNDCYSILANPFLNRLVNKKLNQAKIDTILEPYLNQNLVFQNLQTQLAADGLHEAAPLVDEEQNIFLMPAQDRAVLFGEDNLVLTSPGFILLDSDNDTLADDLELYYGSDPLNADSDKDGYLDGVEVKNNYNPNGSGPLVIAKTPLDQIFASSIKLEQPKTNFTNIDKNWQINLADIKQEETLNLQGKANPNTWLNIFIYSEIPLVLNVKADLEGNWSYALPTKLALGAHTVYAAAYDAEGKIVSQAPVASFAVTEQNDEQEPDQANISIQADPVVAKFNIKDWIYYIIGGAVLLVLVIIGFVWYQKKNKVQA